MMRLDLDGLAAASRELMSEWREVVGRPPPKHLSKPLMVQILSHAYQMDRGRIYQAAGSRVKSSHSAMWCAPPSNPGAAVREYHGITHVVEVGDDGRFVLNEKINKSYNYMLCVPSYAYNF